MRGSISVRRGGDVAAAGAHSPSEQRRSRWRWIRSTVSESVQHVEIVTTRTRSPQAQLSTVVLRRSDPPRTAPRPVGPKADLSSSSGNCHMAIDRIHSEAHPYICDGQPCSRWQCIRPAGAQNGEVVSASSKVQPSTSVQQSPDIGAQRRSDSGLVPSSPPIAPASPMRQCSSGIVEGSLDDASVASRGHVATNGAHKGARAHSASQQLQSIRQWIVSTRIEGNKRAAPSSKHALSHTTMRPSSDPTNHRHSDPPETALSPASRPVGPIPERNNSAAQQIESIKQWIISKRGEGNKRAAPSSTRVLPHSSMCPSSDATNHRHSDPPETVLSPASRPVDPTLEHSRVQQLQSIKQRISSERSEGNKHVAPSLTHMLLHTSMRPSSDATNHRLSDTPERVLSPTSSPVGPITEHSRASNLLLQKMVKVKFHQHDAPEATVHPVWISQCSTAHSVLAALRPQVTLSCPDKELRLLKVFSDRIEVLSPDDLLGDLDEKLVCLNMEEVPGAEKRISPGEKLVQVYRLFKDEQGSLIKFEKMYLILEGGESLQDVLNTLEEEEKVPQSQTQKWSFTCVTPTSQALLHSDDIISEKMQCIVSRAWQEYVVWEYSVVKSAKRQKRETVCQKR